MSGPNGESPTMRYIRAARVVTASARGTIQEGVVVVDGSRISAVGPAAPGAVGEPDADDLAGQLAIPVVIAKILEP